MGDEVSALFGVINQRQNRSHTRELVPPSPFGIVVVDRVVQPVGGARPLVACGVRGVLRDWSR